MCFIPAITKYDLALILAAWCVLQLHVVHYNSDKYKSFDEAKDKPDGLAVLAFFYEVKHNTRFLALTYQTDLQIK